MIDGIIRDLDNLKSKSIIGEHILYIGEEYSENVLTPLVGILSKYPCSGNEPLAPRAKRMRSSVRGHSHLVDLIDPIILDYTVFNQDFFDPLKLIKHAPERIIQNHYGADAIISGNKNILHALRESNQREELMAKQLVTYFEKVESKTTLFDYSGIS